MTGFADFTEGFTQGVQPSLKMLQILQMQTLGLNQNTPAKAVGDFINKTTKKLSMSGNPYESTIHQVAGEYNLPPRLLTAIVAKESNFNPNALNKNSQASGLMQIIPSTQKYLKLKNPFDPTENLRAGARYYSQLKKQFGSDELALAAYNAGPGNVQKYGGIPPFQETQDYVSTILANYNTTK